MTLRYFAPIIDRIQAAQLSVETFDEILAMQPDGLVLTDATADGDGIWVPTAYGKYLLKPGDWVVRYSDGSLDALTAAEFTAAYRLIADPDCVGDVDCKVSVHAHGCFADLGNCDDPGDHVQELSGGVA